MILFNYKNANKMDKTKYSVYICCNSNRKETRLNNHTYIKYGFPCLDDHPQCQLYTKITNSNYSGFWKRNTWTPLKLFDDKLYILNI